MSRRRCKGTTKKGTRCMAAPLTDQDFCLAHADEETRASAGFGGPQENSGRPKVPTPTDVARKLIEDNIAAILRPHFRALGYDVEVSDDGPVLRPTESGGAKVSASFRGMVSLSDIDDLGAQQEAAERLLDRVYGKPKQATELTGADGEPLQPIVLPSTKDWEQGIAEVAARLQPAGHRGNGSRNGSR